MPVPTSVNTSYITSNIISIVYCIRETHLFNEVWCPSDDEGCGLAVKNITCFKKVLQIPKAMINETLAT